MSPKAPPLPPGLGLIREPRMDDEPPSAKSKGKKTPTRKTTPQTPSKTSPRKTPSIPAFNEGEKDANQSAQKDRKKTSPVPGSKVPSPPAGPKKTPSPRQSPGGRLSRTSKQGSASKLGRQSRGSRKALDSEREEEARPFSQAHEDPITQVEVETGGSQHGDTDQDTARDTQGTDTARETQREQGVSHQEPRGDSPRGAGPAV